jgi:hypothetical protein
MIMLVHLKVVAMLLTGLHRIDLGEKCAEMQFDGEGVHAPFMVVSLSSFFSRSGGVTRRCCSPPIFIDGGV